MPKLKPDTQRARREAILNAAERCFARSGFHRTTMQDICSEAGVSAGALYVYFKSKEDLIAGIAERDRSKLASQLKELAAAPDLVAALGALGAHYAVDEPRHKRVLHIEIGCESTRNPAVGEIFRSVDRFCMQSFVDLFERAQAEGRIAPGLETKHIAGLISVIGDGLFWRRGIDPAFDAQALLPAVMHVVGLLLNPTDQAPTYPIVAPATEGAA